MYEIGVQLVQSESPFDHKEEIVAGRVEFAECVHRLNYERLLQCQLMLIFKSSDTFYELGVRHSPYFDFGSTGVFK